MPNPLETRLRLKPVILAEPALTLATPKVIPALGQTPVTAATMVPPSPQILPLVQPRLTLRPEAIRLINPALALALAGMREPATGVPRQQIKSHISPTVEASDETLFEDPADPSKKFYLPRYRMAKNGDQYRIALSKKGGVGSLVLWLQKVPAPALATQLRGAEELPHTVNVVLKHAMFSEARLVGRQELECKVEPMEGGLKVSYETTNENEYILLSQVLNDSKYEPSLLVRRAIRVALPVTNPVLTTGSADLLHGQSIDLDTGKVLGNASGHVLCENLRGQIRLAPQGTTKVARLGTTDFGAVTREELEKAAYDSEALLTGWRSGAEDFWSLMPTWESAYNTHTVGVWFDAGANEWTIFNQDRQPMPAQAAFYLLARREPGKDYFVHRAAATNINGHLTVLDHPLLNGNPNALLLATQHYQGAYNPHHIGVWYNGSQWTIFNQNRAPMPVQAAFNLEIFFPQNDQRAFLHTATAGNISGHMTYLDHPLLNQNPQAIPFVTPNWQGVYSEHAIGVWYDNNRARWTIFNQNRVAMPTGALFNIVVRPSQQVQLHRVDTANTRGHLTHVKLSTPGNLKTGAVCAVRTAAGNHAKIQIVGSDDKRISVQWVSYAAGPLFRETVRTFEDAMERNPFVFPSNIEGYVYPNGAAGGRDFIYQQHTVNWNGRAHNYYQDPLDARIFYYSPDSFKIRRDAKTPRGPKLGISFQASKTGENAGEIDQVRLTYWAFPYVDPKRIAAAVMELKKGLLDKDEVRLLPLRHGSAKLRLWLPGANDYVAQNVIVDLLCGWEQELTFSLEDFYAVYDALAGERTLLLQGKVDLGQSSSGGESPLGRCDFIARLNDLAYEFSELLEYDETPDAVGLQVTFKNAIESPLKITRLSAACQRGTALSKGVIEQLTWPLTLAPQETVTFRLRPETPLPGTEPLKAIFDADPDSIEVLPDKVALLDAILHTNAQPTFEKTIEVEAAPAHFNSDLVRVQVNFVNGTSVTLTRDALRVNAKVRMSIRKYLTDAEDKGEYSFEVILIYQDKPTPPARKFVHSTDKLFLTSAQLG